MVRKSYSGGTVETTLVGSISNVATTATLTDGSTYPTTTGGPFVIVVDPGTSVEEKILVGTRSSDSLSVMTRGYDGTTAVAHSAGAIVRHVFDAISADESNAHANNNTDDVHTQYFKESEVAALATDIEAAAVAAAAGLAAFPIGVVTPYAGATAPTNWLLCDGSAVDRATYADLYTLVGDTYGAGDGITTFNVPDLRFKLPLGKAASGTGSVLGGTGGTKDAVVVTHNHTQDAHDHTQDAHNHTQNAHGHTADDNETGGHAHAPTGGAVQFAASHAGASNGIVGSPVEKVTFSDMSTAGSHNHNITVANGTATNQSTTANNQATTATNQAAGVSGTDANLPPFLALNYILKAL